MDGWSSHFQEFIEAGLVPLPEEDLPAFPEDSSHGGPSAVLPPEDRGTVLEVGDHVRVPPELEVYVAFTALIEMCRDSAMDRGALVPLVDPFDDDLIPHLDNHGFLNNVFCLLVRLGRFIMILD